MLVAIASVSLIYEHNFMGNIRFVDEIFFLLLLPGFGLLRLTLTRIKNGKNAFLGDRNHIHHLINNKLSLIYTNIILLTPVPPATHERCVAAVRPRGGSVLLCELDCRLLRPRGDSHHCDDYASVISVIICMSSDRAVIATNAMMGASVMM